MLQLAIITRALHKIAKTDQQGKDKVHNHEHCIVMTIADDTLCVPTSRLMPMQQLAKASGAPSPVSIQIERNAQRVVNKPSTFKNFTKSLR